jgi:hypothetical protein
MSLFSKRAAPKADWALLFVSVLALVALPPLVKPDLIHDGRLVEVMRNWHFRAFDLSVVHLGNRHISRPVRPFQELAAQMAPILFPALPS